MSHQEEEPAPLQMMRLVFGGLTAQMVAVAVQMGLPDRLKDGPVAASKVAVECGFSPDATYRLLRGLSALGVLEEHAHQSFSLTPLGNTLRRDIPGSLAGLGWLAGQPWHHSAIAQLGHTVATGESGFAKAHGSSMFEWFATHPEPARAFGDAMSSFSAIEAHLVASAYDFSHVRRVADVGGGHGLLLAEILRRYPELEGVLFELPHAAENAITTFEQEGLLDRVRVVTGDFFQVMPPDCDVYIFKYILHDWDDERARQILRCLAEVMPSDARVLIAEQVLPPVGVRHFSKILDVGVMTMTEGGRERTRTEHAALLASAGFAMVEVTPTPGPLSVIEARLA